MTKIWLALFFVNQGPVWSYPDTFATAEACKVFAEKQITLLAREPTVYAPGVYSSVPPNIANMKYRCVRGAM